MRYLSIDIETTGLDPTVHQIIQIAMILEDTETKLPKNKCPQYVTYVRHPMYSGDPTALAMNSKSLAEIGRLKENAYWDYLPTQKVVSWVYNSNTAKQHRDEDICKKVLEFFEKNEISFNDGITVAGANYCSFDKIFLSKFFPGQIMGRFHRRVIDPSQFYIDWKNDTKIPSLQKSLERAHIDKDVAHNALDDAWDVIELLRKHY